MIEFWKPFSDTVEVSNHGRARKTIMSAVLDGLEQHEISYNYKIITVDALGYLRFTANRKSIYLHHAVAQLFIGDRPEGLVIDHIDRDKNNNHVNNLRYCTVRENNINRSTFDETCPILDIERRTRVRAYTKCLNKRFKYVSAIRYTDSYVIYECSNDMTRKSYILKTNEKSKRCNKEFSSMDSVMFYASCL